MPSPSELKSPAHRPSFDLGVRDRTLVFLHIPKTGGTGLRDVLKSAYGKEERAFIYDPSDLRGAVTRDQLAGLPGQTVSVSAWLWATSTSGSIAR